MKNEGKKIVTIVVTISADNSSGFDHVSITSETEFNEKDKISPMVAGATSALVNAISEAADRVVRHVAVTHRMVKELNSGRAIPDIAKMLHQEADEAGVPKDQQISVPLMILALERVKELYQNGIPLTGLGEILVNDDDEVNISAIVDAAKRAGDGPSVDIGMIVDAAKRAGKMPVV